MPARIAINGFGRIGRAFFRIALGREVPFEVAAVNDLGDAATLAHLLAHDSVHGRLGVPVAAGRGSFTAAGREVRVLSERDPARLPWRELGVDVVVECTGRFRTRADCARHLDAGARKVLVSAPVEDADVMLVRGVNERAYDPARHAVVSNASCTTHCLALVAKVLDESFRVRSGFFTTIHSYTSDQRLLDGIHRDLRRARSSATAIVPTTTGAARAVGNVLPALAGKLDGVSVRVPTPNVSLADFTAAVERPATAAAVNAALREAASGPLRGLLAYAEEPLVSVDYNGDPRSAIVDGPSTAVVGEQVKVLAWYDNEWGFSARLVELAETVAREG